MANTFSNRLLALAKRLGMGDLNEDIDEAYRLRRFRCASSPDGNPRSEKGDAPGDAIALFMGAVSGAAGASA